MNIQKITNIVSWTLGLLGLLFLFILIFQGDDSIEANAMQGSYGFVSYMIWLAIIVLSVVTLSTLVFSLKNIASDKSKLKKFGMSIGSFLLVIVIALFFHLELKLKWEMEKCYQLPALDLLKLELRLFIF